MKRIVIASMLALSLILAACADSPDAKQGDPKTVKATEPAKDPVPAPPVANEPTVTQLTFSGKENSEAYFSPDMKTAIFQAQYEGDADIQVYTMDLATKDVKRVTNNKGKNVCTFFSPDGKQIEFSSTMSKHRPADDIGSYGTMWAYDHSYEIYIANADGTGVKRMTYNDYYDCEGSFSPDGKKLLYTSDRDGNLELYTMEIATLKETRMTFTPDLHEGGSFFSPDGTMIIFRNWATVEKGQRAKVAQVWVMNADGSNPRQVTTTESFNWSPYFGHDSKYILFASNYNSPNRKFDIYRMNLDGTGMQKLTFFDGFDSYPVVSSDGKKMLFSSDRYEGKVHLFLMELPEPVK